AGAAAAAGAGRPDLRGSQRRELPTAAAHVRGGAGGAGRGRPPEGDDGRGAGQHLPLDQAVRVEPGPAVDDRLGVQRVHPPPVMADWTTVAASADVAEGGLIEIDNRGEPVVIARRRGDLYAFEGWCTHEECPLAEGQFTDFEIECYCHGSFFDI